MSEWLLKGGRVIDPATKRDEIADVHIADGAIAAIGQSLSGSGAELIDAQGTVIAPGFVDLHTHLREPGREDEETIATASAAAAAGGYTALCAMPNTDPVCDLGRRTCGRAERDRCAQSYRRSRALGGEQP